MRNLIITLCVLSLCVSACGKSSDNTRLPFQRKQEEAKPLIEKIDSEDLAKLILKPKRAPLDVSRDPFKPLGLVGPYEGKTFVKSAVMDTTAVRAFKFLGVAKIQNEFVAFLKSNQKRGTYRIDDRIQDYTIKNIKEDRIILSNGAQTITLKRGESK